MSKDTAPQEQVLKYRDLISQSEETTQSEKLDLDVQRAKSELELSIAKTRLDLANAKQKLAQSKRANPYKLEAELKANQEVEELEGGLAYAEKVLSERF